MDDSIVRGTTLRKLVRMIRNAGAVEVIVLIGSPPVKFPCFFGIDTPTLGELAAHTMSIDEIRLDIEADKLVYLAVGDLQDCLPDSGRNFCLGCFNKDYPCADKIPADKFTVKRKDR